MLVAATAQKCEERMIDIAFFFGVPFAISALCLTVASHPIRGLLMAEAFGLLFNVGMIALAVAAGHGPSLLQVSNLFLVGAAVPLTAYGIRHVCLRIRQRDKS
jgi:ABC-type Co2+ transport system permease subunit